MELKTQELEFTLPSFPLSQVWINPLQYLGQIVQQNRCEKPLNSTAYALVTSFRNIIFAEKSANSPSHEAIHKTFTSLSQMEAIFYRKMTCQLTKPHIYFDGNDWIACLKNKTKSQNFFRLNQSTIRLNWNQFDWENFLEFENWRIRIYFTKLSIKPTMK